MLTRKMMLARSVDALTAKVAEVVALAEVERANADTLHSSAEREHVSARKLEELADSLTVVVAKLKCEIDKTIEQGLSGDASSGNLTSSGLPVH